MQRIVNDFQREVHAGTVTNGSRIDFSVKIQQVEHLCELKAVCISQAQGTPRNLSFYFRDDKVGLVKDFRKLEKIASANKWILAFVYPKPSAQEWHDAVGLVPNELRHWMCVSSLDLFPEYLFVSLWKG